MGWREKLNQFDLNDLRELDFEDVGSWPLPVRMLLYALVLLLIGGLGYQVFVADQIDGLKRANQEEVELRQKFERKQRRVAKLDALKEQVAQLEQDFESLRGQLPSQTEVANLLQEVSQTRVITGLDEELFKPQSEIPKDFYAELPIELHLLGDFHQFGEFVSGIAALPRIVTLHDIKIEPNQRKARPGQVTRPLRMTAIAKTYRDREDEDSDAEDEDGS